MRRVLVVDDDRRTRRVLQILLERMGLGAVVFETPLDALAHLREEQVALVLTDLRMPGMDGVRFLRELRELDEHVPVIMLTAYGTVESAVEVMKLGAVDYLSKPFDVDSLEHLIRRSLGHARVHAEHRYLREEVDRGPGLEEIVGSSAPIREVLELVRKVAPTRSSVLITGETGTGKELVARAIHRLSPRAKDLFVPINCTAIPADLLESELFGHVRGAFSGAHGDRIGKVQAADGGTLFLDEIGDMETRLQAKLLRVLQEGVVEPVGSNRRVPVDVRIVSSTNRDLEVEMREGRFREDLYFRLDVFRIRTPPLSERGRDVREIAAVLLESLGRELGRGTLGLEPAAAALLEQQRWRGNVRELRNVMERAAVLCEGSVVDEALLGSILPAAGEPASASGDGGAGALDLAAALADTERRTILAALDRTGDNKVAAAELLGIGERTLWTKLKKHGL